MKGPGTETTASTTKVSHSQRDKRQWKMNKVV